MERIRVPRAFGEEPLQSMPAPGLPGFRVHQPSGRLKPFGPDQQALEVDAQRFALRRTGKDTVQVDAIPVQWIRDQNTCITGSVCILFESTDYQ